MSLIRKSWRRQSSAAGLAPVPEASGEAAGVRPQERPPPGALLLSQVCRCSRSQRRRAVSPQALSEMDEFKNLDNDIEGSATRWKKFVESEAPEKEIFPTEWKNKTALQKLCMVRCMRPDRMTYAIK